ncbi:hypothetical protein [Citrobacter freundii]|uniref:hypothetical protein n=1 Tax=Citrobacter freundii TaxID=546 RepID=UPI001C66931F|nr:hypothetical protein [Citrobacter freundii]
MVTLGVGIAGSGQKTGQRMPRSGHSEHPAGVRHQFGMLSAFSVEHCPPSRWNTVRHQHGIVSAIAWNTHLRVDALADAPVEHRQLAIHRRGGALPRRLNQYPNVAQQRRRRCGRCHG